MPSSRRTSTGSFRSIHPNIVYYHVVPPLRFAGTEEVRRNFLRWFDGYEGPISLETHDLTIVTSEDAAFANMLHLDSGERKGLAGPVSSIWVRETACLRRSNDRWVIAHEHISIPFDPVSFAKSYLLGLLQHLGRRAKKPVRPARSARSAAKPRSSAPTSAESEVLMV